MVTSSTRGVSSQRASSSRSRRAVVDLPTATEPATPITNGVRCGCVAAGTSLVARCSAPAPRDVEVEQPAERQVDLAHLAQVERVAEAAQLHDLGLGQGQRRARRERGPGGAVDLDEGRVGRERAGSRHRRATVRRSPARRTSARRRTA